jgi:hypothetical protein
MSQHEQLPTKCTIRHLHEWLIHSERRMPRQLRRLIGHRSVKALREVPDIQLARREWDNPRPFPSDAQLLTMAALFSPSRDLDRFDEAGAASLVVVLSIMALPDPLPEAVWIDTLRRCLWADERLEMVERLPMAGAPSV